MGGWGWPGGSNETGAKSAQFGLNWVLAGLSLAKNGNARRMIFICIFGLFFVFLRIGGQGKISSFEF